MNEDFLNRKLKQRQESFALRELRPESGGIDFCSNDYLGIVSRNLLSQMHGDGGHRSTGSTGSRLISGNYPLIEEAEKMIAAFHEASAGLIFNSGYDANLGLLGAVAQRGDTVIYDQLSHVSIRDGIRLSHACSYSFAHNNLEDLEKKLQVATGTIFVVTESVFSMDGDMAPLKQIVELCRSYGAHLIVDEAHATGVIGDRGEGLVQQLGLVAACFARVHTFGKALGCHGAIVLGSQDLKNYLVNFSRPFIYTTALPASAIQAVMEAYKLFPALSAERMVLRALITQFKSQQLGLTLSESDTAIQGVIIAGNEEVKSAAAQLQSKGFDVRPILYPTVPKGTERLRVVLHAFNTADEVDRLLSGLRELH